MAAVVTMLIVLLSAALLAAADKRVERVERAESASPCASKTTCGECIQTPDCAWCFQADFGNDPRCFLPGPTAGLCHEEYVYQPENRISMTDNRDLSEARTRASASGSSSSSSSAEIVQIRPQRVRLELRANQAYRMDVWYAQAEDYPVDLYYLMDLSKSMADDKEKLSALGDLLAESMKEVTSDFRLGFGSFVDKVVMPYVSTTRKKLEEPCQECAAPYGYQNAMSLSTNTERFSEEVRRANVSGNLDAPEGGFDAIMQAVVCRRQIGWREKARRLLVFSTDADFHYAGDGKLGGIVKPNDGECHLDPSGLYRYSSLQDYPSISQLNLKVVENSINVIFAVTSGQLGLYEQLKTHIQGSSAGMLSDDSSNVVDFVKDQYGRISSSVEMKDNSTGAVGIRYRSNCLGKGAEEETNRCDGLKVGDRVRFSAEITVTSCPKDPAERHQVIQIYPVGINESMIVELTMLCDCPCERPGHAGYEERSRSCGGSGTYTCGVCDCDSSHFGQNCECSVDSVSNLHNDTRGCMATETATVECSGRGVCSCGQCKCNSKKNEDGTEAIYGKFCECDNLSCDRDNGLICSGPDHGRCDCGVCVCNPGWTGKACDCRSSDDTCKPPGGGEICSGHGKCVCGQCICDSEDEGRYSGRYCDKCPTCSGRCAEFKECVQCQVYRTGPKMENDQCSNCTFTPDTVPTVEVNEDKDENLCSYYDEDDCRFTFVYSYDEHEKVVIRAQEKRECPPQVFILGIVLGVIAAIVLIGLALLMLWKMVTTIHDRREFARFEKERMMAKWDTGENPIYKQATSTFKNPTYAGK